MSFLRLGSLTLHYRKDGAPDGPPIVFINSLGTDLRIWDDLLPYLGHNYSLLRYDKRGHGLSDCPPPPCQISDHATDLERLIDALGLQAPLLLGISVGGMIALEYAARPGNQLAGLVLSDTLPQIGSPTMWDDRISAIRAGGMAPLAPAILSRWFAPAFAERDPARYQGYLNMLTRMPVDGYISACEAIRDADLDALVEHIHCPVLAICGEHDLATTPVQMRALAQHLPGQRYVQIADAGHLPPIEVPEIFAAVLRSFMKEIGYD